MADPVKIKKHEKSTSDLLIEHKNQILEDFVKAVREEMPLVRSQKDSLLIDTIPELIDRIAVRLVQPENQASIQKIEESSIQHAETRAAITGYNVIQVLSEYHLLRRIIVDTLANFGTISHEERKIINNVIDRGIARAGQAFFDIWNKQTKDTIDRLSQERILREQFIYSVSHDLRNPIASLKMITDLMKNKINNEVFISEQLIRSSGILKRLDQVIQNILDTGRANSGRFFPVSIIKTYLKPFLEEIYNESRTKFGDRFVLTTIDATFYCDPLNLRRAIDNLIENAVKYGYQNMPITIHGSESKDSDSVLIDIIDHGPILTEDIKKTLFLPFSQGKNQTAGGWGIGRNKKSHKCRRPISSSWA